MFRGAAFPWQKDLTIGFIVANKHNNADTSQRLSHLKYFFTLLCNFVCFISAEGIRKSYVLILFPAGVIGNILSFMVRNYQFYFWKILNYGLSLIACQIKITESQTSQSLLSGLTKLSHNCSCCCCLLRLYRKFVYHFTQK